MDARAHVVLRQHSNGLRGAEATTTVSSAAFSRSSQDHQRLLRPQSKGPNQGAGSTRPILLAAFALHTGLLRM